MSRYSKSDYINREMAADSIVIECDGVTLEQARQALKDCPSADVVKREHATDKGYESNYNWVDVCSLCGCEFTTSQGANYCPNCGARLDDKEYEQEIIDARKGEE